MFTIEELLDGLRISRSAFARIFLSVQDAPLQRRVEFEAVGTVSDDREAFRAALTYAAGNGLLAAIQDELFMGNFVSDALLKRRLDQAGNAPLQAMVNEAAGFIEPAVLHSGTLRAMRATARILINGQFQGSGVLVSPQLVLTAWHVVKPLFEQQPQPGSDWQLLKPPPAKVTVEFDNVVRFNRNGAMQAPAPQFVETQAEWLVAHCRCHLQELNQQLPADPRELDDCWDYAVIKLVDALDRGEFPMDLRAQVPKSKQELMVVQYPAGQPQKASKGVILPSVQGLATGMTEYRFFHDGNALGGSSGSPCFDKHFALFGIHQGAVHDAQGKPLANRGVAIAKIIDHFRGKIGDLPSVDLAARRIANLGASQDDSPVIGRDDFQRLLWRSATGDQKRLLTVSGPGAGCGKTFCVELLKAALPDEGHLKITLPAASIATLDAVAVSGLIRTGAGLAPVATSPPGEPNSSEAVWLRDDVLIPLIAELDRLRRTRTVWILITELNKQELTNRQGAELLLMLYAQVRTVPWLRIVLDGMRGSIPSALESCLERYRIRDIGASDIEAYLRRTLGSLKALPDDETALRVGAKGLMRQYEDALARDPATALAELQRAVLLHVGDYL